MGEFIDATTFTMEVTEVMEHKRCPWVPVEASDLIEEQFLASDRIEGDRRSVSSSRGVYRPFPLCYLMPAECPLGSDGLPRRMLRTGTDYRKLIRGR